MPLQSTHQVPFIQHLKGLSVRVFDLIETIQFVSNSEHSNSRGHDTGEQPVIQAFRLLLITTQAASSQALTFSQCCLLQTESRQLRVKIMWRPLTLQLPLWAVEPKTGLHTECATTTSAVPEAIGWGRLSCFIKSLKRETMTKLRCTNVALSLSWSQVWLCFLLHYILNVIFHNASLFSRVYL